MVVTTERDAACAVCRWWEDQWKNEHTNLKTRYYRNDDKQKQEDNLSSDRTTQKSNNNNSIHLPQIGLTCR